jgi:branched-chain amino acid transport system substrate-binding protein
LFGATAWDALLISDQAARVALKTAKPGTAEFRTAMRDAIEQTKGFVGTEGVYTMTAQDHNGVDERSQVMIKIENGKWVLQP